MVGILRNAWESQLLIWFLLSTLGVTSIQVGVKCIHYIIYNLIIGECSPHNPYTVIKSAGEYIKGRNKGNK